MDHGPLYVPNSSHNRCARAPTGTPPDSEGFRPVSEGRNQSRRGMDHGIAFVGTEQQFMIPVPELQPAPLHTQTDFELCLEDRNR